MNWLKHNPVLVYMMVLAGLTVFSSEALTNHLLSGRALSWIDLAIAVISAIGGVVVHNQVTPLADPKLDSHTPLVPGRVQTVVANTTPDPTVVATEFGPGHVSTPVTPTA